MGFFKNINANMDFKALERYIKTKGWRIDGSALDLFNTAVGYWGGSFETVFDHTWSFTLVNGIYMIDSCVLFGGATYHNIHALGDYTGVLFQAMIDKKPIRVIAAAKYADSRHVDIKFIFDINNGDRKIVIYEIRRKIKKYASIAATYNPNYNFEHNYTKQQQKLAKRYAGRNRW